VLIQEMLLLGSKNPGLYLSDFAGAISRFWEVALTITKAKLSLVPGKLNQFAFLLFLLLASSFAFAQEPTLGIDPLHQFSGVPAGQKPSAGLTADRAGNFYGTTIFGGVTPDLCELGGCGTVFKMSRQGQSWIFSSIYQFHGGSDGANPWGRVVIGPDGALYGFTHGGGTNTQCQGYGCGTVFRLTPPSSFCRAVLCPWTETVLYRFQGQADGAMPVGDLTFDASGAIYGTTSQGGNSGCSGHGCGVVFKLSRSGGGWAETVLYTFVDSPDGAAPYDGVTFDAAGNMYGTTSTGGTNQRGTIFELSPSGSGWTETILHSFAGADGLEPFAGVILDAGGNLYGATAGGGPVGGGVAYKLSHDNGGWTYSMLDNFFGGIGPMQKLTLDSAGNLYGANQSSGIGPYYGQVWELTPSGGQWTETILYDFTNYFNGQYPNGGIWLDAGGNLYGTTQSGGTGSDCITFCGIVWELER
jgi:uncharacterized repeat protein (TIGR03803 family)